MVPANAGVEACFSRAIFWHCFQSSLKEKELGALDQVDGSTEVGEILEQNMVLLASKIIENQKLTIQNIYAVWIENLVFAQKSAIGWRRYISHISYLRKQGSPAGAAHGNEILWAPTTQEPTGLHNDLKQKIKRKEQQQRSPPMPFKSLRFPQ